MLGLVADGAGSLVERLAQLPFGGFGVALGAVASKDSLRVSFGDLLVSRALGGLWRRGCGRNRDSGVENVVTEGGGDQDVIGKKSMTAGEIPSHSDGSTSAGWDTPWQQVGVDGGASAGGPDPRDQDVPLEWV